MAMNLDRPDRWPEDVDLSVRLYNQWYKAFGPEAYKQVRRRIADYVGGAFKQCADLRELTGAAILASPSAILPTLRMCTAPPLAVDRVVGLSGTKKSIVAAFEEGKRPRLSGGRLRQEADKVADLISEMLDPDLFVWVMEEREPTEGERANAIAVVSDRLCGSIANPIIRNRQEQRQLELLSDWLDDRGYRKHQPEAGLGILGMPAGTYAWRVNVPAGGDGAVNVPVDMAIQPVPARPSGFPLLVEAKSAGDFTNVNKRRKEEAQKVRMLRAQYGEHVDYVLLLGGFFDIGYLEYEAKEGIDWVWEHRIEDLEVMAPRIPG